MTKENKFLSIASENSLPLAKENLLGTKNLTSKQTSLTRQLHLTNTRNTWRNANHPETHNFSNCHFFDEHPISTNKVLVSFHKEVFVLQKGDYIQGSFITMLLKEFHYEIDFMVINKSRIAPYIKKFCQISINMRCEGRCIVSKNPSKSNKLCPELTEDAFKVKILPY